MEEKAIKVDESALKNPQSVEIEPTIQTFLEDIPIMNTGNLLQSSKEADSQAIQEKNKNELSKENSQTDDDFLSLNNAVGVLNWIINLINNSNIPFDQNCKLDIDFAESIEDYEDFPPPIRNFSFPMDMSKMEPLRQLAYLLTWYSSIDSGRAFDSTSTITLKNSELALSLKLRLTKLHNTNSSESPNTLQDNKPLNLEKKN